MEKEKKKVAVLGLGRFGSFWANLLSSQFEVIVWSRNSSYPTPEGVRKVSWEGLFDAEAIFLCCAISSVGDVAEKMVPFLRKGTVVLDTCSVKLFPLETLKRILPDDIEILGTHPMFGPDSAKNGVKGLPLVLSSCREKKETFDFWQETFIQLNLSVLSMSADQHDREAAYSQGIAQFMGRLLNVMGASPTPLATKNYNVLLELSNQVCKDSWQLFMDLQQYNPYAAQMRQSLAQAMATLQESLVTLDPEESP